MKEISFYSRFSQDIRNGNKVITIRDQSESDFVAGETVRSVTNPEEEWIADLLIKNVYPIHLNDLSECHAQQENMTLPELRQVIESIYPGEQAFYVIEFAKVLD